MNKTLPCLAAICIVAGCASPKAPVTSLSSVWTNATQVAADISSGNYASAQSVFDEYCRKHTKTMDGGYALNWLYYLLVNNVDMLDELNAWCSSPDATYSAYALRGRWHVQEAWRKRGNGWANTVDRSMWAAFSRNLALAQADLEKAYAMNPGDPNAAREMIVVCMGQCSSIDEERIWFDRAIENHADHLDAYSSMAWAQYPRWGGNEKDLLDFIDSAVQSHPENPEFATLKTSWYFNEREQELKQADSPASIELQALLLDYANRATNSSRPYREMAQLAWLRGQKPEAIACMDKAIQIEPSFQNYSKRGYYNAYAKNYEAARSDLGRALAQTPYDADALDGLAYVEYRSSRYEKAIELYSRLFRINPGKENSTARRGLCYEKIGKFDEAKADLEKSLALNPRSDWVWFQLGHIEWSHFKNADKAILCYTKSIALDPPYHLAYFRRGQIYKETGRYKEALVDFEKAVSLKKGFLEKAKPDIEKCKLELEKQLSAGQCVDPIQKVSGE